MRLNCELEFNGKVEVGLTESETLYVRIGEHEEHIEMTELNPGDITLIEQTMQEMENKTKSIIEVVTRGRIKP